MLRSGHSGLTCSGAASMVSAKTGAGRLRRAGLGEEHELLRDRRDRVHRPLPRTRAAATRQGTVYVLVRGRSLGKLDELKEFWGKEAARRVIPVKGDLAQAGLGSASRICASSRARSHTSSTSAPSTTSRPAPRRCRANILGTEHALAFAHAVGAGCFHFVSSIAAAGVSRHVHRGHVRGSRGARSPYHRTKHDSEGMVRANDRVLHLPARRRRRAFADRHRQDRRALLLLQGAAEAARVLAALGPAGRRRGAVI